MNKLNISALKNPHMISMYCCCGVESCKCFTMYLLQDYLVRKKKERTPFSLLASIR